MVPKWTYPLFPGILYTYAERMFLWAYWNQPVSPSVFVSIWVQNTSFCQSASFSSTPHYILSKQLAVFHITIIETMASGERGMNYVAMVYHQSSEKYWPCSGIEPATSCSQVLYGTD